MIDGPVNSNRLAPPTKHTAIFELTNSSFFPRRRSEVSVVAVRVWVWIRLRRGARVGRGSRLRVDRESKKRRDTEGIMRTRRRRWSTSETLLATYMTTDLRGGVSDCNTRFKTWNCFGERSYSLLWWKVASTFCVDCFFFFFLFPFSYFIYISFL